MASNFMAADDQQGRMTLIRPAQKVDVPLELVRSRKTQGQAFTLACDYSGKEDKELALELGIDAGTWSRLKSGTNTLSGDRMQEFCRAVGNTALPEWVACQIGCTLVVIKTEAERRAEIAEARALEAEQKLAWAMDALKGR